jgi:5-formyltetrahydrofolate cyclo-ligase
MKDIRINRDRAMAVRERYTNSGYGATVKAEIRQVIWRLLGQQGVARFPGVQNRVPNFVGADKAAQLLRELTVWRKAQVIKVGVDAPQLPVRRAALADGKIVYMAVPQLKAEKCFVELDPHRLGSRVTLATSLRGALKYGRLVAPREMRNTDLIVCGSVAASRDGARLGKGGGFSDLEYGLLREEGKVRELTPVITTIHPLQLVLYKIPMFPHDLPVDFLITATEVIPTRSIYPRPRGIYWDLLREIKINAIPILRKRLRQGGTGTRQG